MPIEINAGRETGETSIQSQRTASKEVIHPRRANNDANCGDGLRVGRDNNVRIEIEKSFF